MQTFSANTRFRGWRESKKLADIAHSIPTDLKETTAAAQLFENTYNSTTRPLVDTLTLQDVSNLQHLRVQIKYRVSFDLG